MRKKKKKKRSLVRLHNLLWCPHIALLFAAPITVWRSKWIEVRCVVLSTYMNSPSPFHNLWLRAMLLLLSLQLEICSTFLLVSLLLFIYYLNFQYMYAWVSLPIPWIGICGGVQTGRSFVFLAFYPFGPLLSPLEQEHMRIQKKFYFTSLKSILSILLSHFITHLIF